MSESKQGFFRMLGFGKSSGSGTSALFSQARMKMEQEDVPGALDDFNKVLELDPEKWFAYYFRGLVRASLGDFRAAMADYDYAILHHPHCSRVFFFARAEAKFLTDDFEGAITDFTKALELKNCEEAPPVANEVIYFRRGLTKLKLDQQMSGCSDLRKAASAGCAEAAEALKKYCPEV